MGSGLWEEVRAVSSRKSQMNSASVSTQDLWAPSSDTSLLWLGAKSCSSVLHPPLALFGATKALPLYLSAEIKHHLKPGSSRLWFAADRAWHQAVCVIGWGSSSWTLGPLSVGLSQREIQLKHSLWKQEDRVLSPELWTLCCGVALRTIFTRTDFCLGGFNGGGG